MKIAVSLPARQVDDARLAVDEGRAASVSAYIAEALAQQHEADALAQLVAAMRAEDGRPDPEDYAWADRALGLTREDRRRVTSRS